MSRKKKHERKHPDKYVSLVERNLRNYLAMQEKYKALQKEIELNPRDPNTWRQSMKAKKKNKRKLRKAKSAFKIKPVKIKSETKNKISVAEQKIIDFLTLSDIRFVREAKYPKLINPRTKHPLRFDFYIPSTRTAIEYDGVQHFKVVPEFHGYDEAKAQGKLATQMFLDSVENGFCIENNIRLIRLNKEHYYQMESHLSRLLKL
jgi:very-short-patch-repair endonuclease